MSRNPRHRANAVARSTTWNLVARVAGLALVSLLLTLMQLSRPATAAGNTRVVSPDGPYTTIAAALADARPGEQISVRGGVYAGPLVVDKTVALLGEDAPIIDGDGEGTVVTITASGVRFEGFTIRNSGDSLDHEDAGIVVKQTTDTLIAGNRLENTLFGVYAKNSPRTELRSNYIVGMDLPVPRRGDGIRFWESPDSLIAENTVESVRDCILWFSDGSTVRDNTLRDGRYGLHLMYDNDIVIVDNTAENNSVGAFLMYSRDVTLERNIFRNNRGPSGYGVGLKDMDRVVGEDNLFISNRIGLYLDNSPWSIDVYDEFRHNVFAYNDIGLSFQPAVKRNIFTENTFLENMEQVLVRGGGQLEGNQWTVAGQGNYWSDYTGYDADGDGLGDLAYQPRSLFESLMDRHPSLRLFTMSPAQQAIDMASRAFPVVRPEPKLTDAAPLMSPVVPAIALDPRPSPLPMLAAGAGAALLGMLLFGLARWDVGGQLEFAAGSGPVSPSPTDDDVGVNMIEIRNMTKQFGHTTAVDSFNLTVKPGEAVALWGPNGAGKTTIIKALLGLLHADGEVTVNGYTLKTDGKAVRRAIGYVPQELSFYGDMTTLETTRFFARLKRVTSDRVDDVLDQVGLAEHRSKRVAALSGGMKQRLALALALLADPQVLILDEPTSNLDAEARDSFLDMLANLNEQGKTLLFTSHRLEEVEALADRVVALDQGRIRLETGPHDLASELGLQVTLKVYVPATEIDRALATLTAEGFSVSRNGAGVRVRVTPREKVAPIQALTDADIAVQNFEVENGSWN